MSGPPECAVTTEKDRMSSSKSVKKKGHILIVDDDDVLRNALQKNLEKEGFDVATADAGKAAQTMVAIESFDVVISDIHMPGSPAAVN